MSRLGALLVLALPAWLAACGDSDAGASDGDVSVDAGSDDGSEDAAGDAGPDAAAPLTTQQWCTRSNTAWCDWMYSCLSGDELATAERSLNVTEASCAGRLTADCQTRTMESVAAGRQSFDGQAAAACIEALALEPCGSWEQLVAGEALNPDACHGITHGLVAAGDACSNTLDCAADDAWCWTEAPGQLGYCTDSLGAGAFQWQCSEDNATECPGRVCRLLPPNEPEWAGVCSANCRVDRNCGPGAGCFSDDEGARFCLAVCEDDEDCVDGLACLPVGDRRACLSRPR